MSNVRTIQEIYAAFGRGDVPAILSRLAESVEWEYGPTSTNVPWLQRRRGRDGAAAFFASLAHFEMHAFRPKEFLEGDGVVVVLLDVDFTVRATGRRIVEEDEIRVAIRCGGACRPASTRGGYASAPARLGRAFRRMNGAA